MAYENIAISLPEELARAAENLAAERGISVSKLIAALVAELVLPQRRYEEARERQLALLSEGLPLGTHGAATWSRDDLHER